MAKPRFADKYGGWKGVFSEACNMVVTTEGVVNVWWNDSTYQSSQSAGHPLGMDEAYMIKIP